MNLIINCDGGSRGNPGSSACAFVVQSVNSAGKMREIFHQATYLDIGTNNRAEYFGVIMSLKWLKEYLIVNSADFPAQISFFLDSNLVVSQINGIFKIKDQNLRQQVALIHTLKREIEALIPQIVISFTHIPREQNQTADLLVNKCLNETLNKH